MSQSLCHEAHRPGETLTLRFHKTLSVWAEAGAQALAGVCRETGQ